LSGGYGFTKRKELTGQVAGSKTILFKNEGFYKINYRASSVEFIEHWMKSEDFDLQ
jgi:hypothetical protein